VSKTNLRSTSIFKQTTHFILFYFLIVKKTNNIKSYQIKFDYWSDDEFDLISPSTLGFSDIRIARGFKA